MSFSIPSPFALQPPSSQRPAPLLFGLYSKHKAKMLSILRKARVKDKEMRILMLLASHSRP